MMERLRGIFAGGLTKREYFAAMALQGSLACPMTPESLEHLAVVTRGDPEKIAAIQARWAVVHADALIAALSVKGQF